jgi:hypothetical protein
LNDELKDDCLWKDGEYCLGKILDSCWTSSQLIKKSIQRNLKLMKFLVCTLHIAY